MKYKNDEDNMETKIGVKSFFICIDKIPIPINNNRQIIDPVAVSFEGELTFSFIIMSP